VDVFRLRRQNLVPELPRFADGSLREYPPIKTSRSYRSSARFAHPPRSTASSWALAILSRGALAALPHLYGCACACSRTRSPARRQRPWTSPGFPRRRRWSARSPHGARGRAVTPPRIPSAWSLPRSRRSIAATLASESYRALTEPDADRCPACRHAALCRRAGMVRPSECTRDSVESPPYCVRCWMH
jgi:hypothetical protein